MQQFVISGVKSEVNIEPKLELVTALYLSHKICYGIIVKML